VPDESSSDPRIHAVVTRDSLFKNSVRTSKRTQPFTITNIILLTLFKEIDHVYTYYHAEPINIKFKELVIVKLAGTYSYHPTLKS
jgi:hypothetical protein